MIFDIYYADNGRVAAYFVGKGTLAGSNGNRYRVTLNRLNDAPRYFIKLWTPSGGVVGQVVAVTSLASMVAQVAATAALKDVIDMVVIQDVNEVFVSSSFADAVPFSGGN